MNLEPFPPIFEQSSLIAVKVETRASNGQAIDVGTGFWFRPSEGHLYLVTNWHIVTGRQPQAPSLSASGAVPTQLVARVHRWKAENEIATDLFAEFAVRLNDPDGEDPQWLEHPILRHRADVVALRVDGAVGLGELAIAAIGDDGIFDSTPGYEPRVMGDVFVIGFPWGLAGGTSVLPIYKRGAIASEPGLPQSGLPRFLIDCRSARGMSGSPVVAGGVAWGGVGKDGQQLLAANAKVFAGIYSGRLRVDALQLGTDDSASMREEAAGAISEIGIVWRRDVLFELVTAAAGGSRVSEL